MTTFVFFLFFFINNITIITYQKKKKKLKLLLLGLLYEWNQWMVVSELFSFSFFRLLWFYNFFYLALFCHFLLLVVFFYTACELRFCSSLCFCTISDYLVNNKKKKNWWLDVPHSWLFCGFNVLFLLQSVKILAMELTCFF